MENLEIINNNNSMISQRIESVDDIAVNRVLFSIYEQLIPPVKRIETLFGKINGSYEHIEDLNSLLTVIVYKSMKISAIVGGIIGLIVLILNFNDFSDMMEGIKVFDMIYNVIEHLDVPDFIGVILELIFLLFQLSLPLIFFSTMIFAVLYLLSRLVKIVFAKLIAKEKEEIEESKREIEEIQSQISTAISFVPCNYRYSKALEIMVSSFANSKVDNLKEAVINCDTELHREREIECYNRMIDALQSIKFNQLQTQHQIRRLREDIWISEILF